MEFSGLNKEGLKSECLKRGLPVSGTNAVLLLRLKEDDDNKARNSRPLHPSRSNSLPNRSRPTPQIASPSRAALSELTESQLEQLCRESFLPKHIGDQISQRFGEIESEFNDKRNEAFKKRDDAVKRAETKCTKDVEKLAKERDGKLDEIKADREKQRNWLPAFGRLRDLKLARGIRIHPHDYDPSRHRPAPPSMEPSSPTNSPLSFQAAAFRNSRAASPSPVSTMSMRSTATTATNSTTGTATTTSNKRRVSEMDDEDESSSFRNAPSGPRTQLQPSDHRLSNIPIFRAQLSNITSHIFISARNLRVEVRQIEAMYAMLDREDRFRVSRIRGDPEGYYWIFDSEQGDARAASCYQHFQGRLFHGVPMQLELRLRVAGALV